MKFLAALCMVALAVSHPVNDNNAKPNLMHKRSIASEDVNILNVDHKNVRENIVKRDVEDTGDAVKAMCAEGSGESCGDQNAEDHIIQKRDAQNIDEHDIEKRDTESVGGSSASQDKDIQEAWSKEGAYAKQGEGGQSVYASDFGGPIVQILQHLYKSNCCECGCDCGCPEVTPDASG